MYDIISLSLNIILNDPISYILGECMSLWGEPNKPSTQHHAYIFMLSQDIHNTI